MKICEFHSRIIKNMKTLELNLRIMKIMKTIKYHKITQKNHENIRIP